MTVKDINEIIKIVCPNDEDYEKPCISPKYLRQELEQLALEQEHRHLEQEPRKGHWIEGQTDNSNIHNILCSRCFEGYPSKGHANSQYTKEKFQWCPKCGAKMVEPQESEDKE